ncbi:MAG TPA: rhamnulokinase family protein [Anaerolineaceae bacterium]|nr:rhamnulokinase family protein [Anaerolineaceae bacterium]
MSKNPSFLAIDLGAESGRAVLGCLENNILSMEEIHRFANGPIAVGSSLYWNTLKLWDEIQASIHMATQKAGPDLVSLGVDTWGVDFALLGEGDELLGNPHHYRDSRNDGMLAEAFRRVPKEEIYRQTGIQFMQINSLYQLLSMRIHQPSILDTAQTFLTIPDLFNFWLTGVKASEFSISTTTQCYDPTRKAWATDLLSRLDIPAHIFQAIVPSGTRLGALRQSAAPELVGRAIEVIATTCHDTASAVAAVPANQPGYIFLSSGTWSLMGIEIPGPIINAKGVEYNLTNEGGANGTIRLLKNISGLWLLQECRREWARHGQTYDYGELTRLAESAAPFHSLVRTSDSRFLAPGDMTLRIRAYCAESQQPVPESVGEVCRCILESLALEYRTIAVQLEEMVGHGLPVIHIIGGGSRNRLLNQFTANATGKTVIAGPVEATSIGNILIQAISMGMLGSIQEGRALVRRSFDLEPYSPMDALTWEKAYDRYRNLPVS